MTPLELGTHPKPTQIAEALVYLGGRGAWSPAHLMKALEDYLGFGGLFRLWRLRIRRNSSLFVSSGGYHSAQ